MKCHTPGCTVKMNWFRRYVLKRPGYYLESCWYCSETCLEKGVAGRLEKRGRVRNVVATSRFHLKLEHILLGSGVITREQLNMALAEPVGDPAGGLWHRLIALGLVNERDITLALSRLFNIPVIKVNSRRISSSVLNIIPIEIVANHSFFPLEFDHNEKRLVLVTHDPADLSVIVKLRGILDCEVTTYLSEESVVRGMIAQYCRLSALTKADGQIAHMGSPNGAHDIAHWIVRRAKTIHAQSLQVCCLDEFIWTRFLVGQKPFNCVLSATRAA